MAEGRTLVLLNHDSIFEALYDVLNQRFLTKTDPTTGEQASYLRLAIGTRSQLCAVSPGFRIIVVAECDHAYNKLDVALLNRFEKQVFSLHLVLDPRFPLLFSTPNSISSISGALEILK